VLGDRKEIHVRSYVHQDRYSHRCAVQILCATRGDIDRPRSLDEMKAFVRDMIVDKPVPGWFFQLLDELHEVEASVTISNIRLRKFPSSESVEIHS
jgi:hypothetical protein